MKKNFRLKDQDLLMLKYLLESDSHSLTKEQIIDNFYFDLNSLEKKLWEYVKYNILESYTRPLTGGIIYTCGYKGYQILKANRRRLKEALRRSKNDLLVRQSYYSPTFYTLHDQPNISSYWHDEALMNLRFFLEDLGAYNYKTSKLIYKEFYGKDNYFSAVPDSIFDWNFDLTSERIKYYKYLRKSDNSSVAIKENNGENLINYYEWKDYEFSEVTAPMNYFTKKIALEFEFSPKDSSGYKQKLNKYKTDQGVSENIDYILYLAENRDIYHKMKLFFQKNNCATSEDNFYLALLDNFKRNLLTYDNKGNIKKLFNIKLDPPNAILNSKNFRWLNI